MEVHEDVFPCKDSTAHGRLAPLTLAAKKMKWSVHKIIESSKSDTQFEGGFPLATVWRAHRSLRPSSLRTEIIQAVSLLDYLFIHKF